MGNGAVLMEKPVCKDKDIGGSITAEIERLGIQLQVKVDGVSVKWQNNGYIPDLCGSEKAEIGLTCGKSFWGFNVALGKDKVVIEAKNYTPKSCDKKVYHKTIHIENGARTNYPVNNIRLLRPCDGHRFKITEIGIVFQNLDGFLTIQDVYEEDCHQGKDGVLVCLAFEKKWPSLIEFLHKIQKQGGFAELPLLKPATTTPKKKTFGGTKEGFVKFFNLNAGFGVIETISGDTYVESESIASDKKPLFLPKGAKVAFRNLIPSDKDGTFKRKAIGVRVMG